MLDGYKFYDKEHMLSYRFCPLKAHMTTEVEFDKDELGEIALLGLKESLFTNVEEQPDGSVIVEFAGGICMEGDCAWWDDYEETCCMKSIAISNRKGK